MAKKRSLRSYQAKRNFGRSPEPRSGGSKGKLPRFVIQEHAARSHHWDFRLEADGVLKSWAIPKGPSTDPREKRLAVPTEDHPLAYGDFEGLIPEGEYGAGSVIVWDAGTYENITEKEGRLQPVSEAITNGHLLVRLHGQKLEGGFALQRVGDQDRWLLVKMRDSEADARRNPTSTQPESVLSDRTVEEVAGEAAQTA